MSTRMLINATHEEEKRVAHVDGQFLIDLDIEHPGQEQKTGNIYKGTVSRPEAHLEAAFVDYGEGRHGFLPLKEVAEKYYPAGFQPAGDRPTITETLKAGQELLVQVEKEERGSKGAALTTFISLAGSYLVLMPNNPKAGGISRRIEGEERNELREVLSQINVPESMGIIVRTAGVGKTAEQLNWDLELLLKQWEAIQAAAQESESPCLIYQESDAVLRAIRDHLRDDITEILVDSKPLYEKIKKYIKQVRPDKLRCVKLYQHPIPLFNRFQIESQIETAFEREVRLPSGGSIVIDHTEAMVSVDVNSAKATKGADIEETAFNTNSEAADEIARQLRLRDIGGLIVIDFIDMYESTHQREVENSLRESLRMDRARVQFARISRFGLLEMSRQRLRPSLGESLQITCPRCHGQGNIRGIESLSLAILRLIREHAMKDGTARVEAQLPVSVATFLLNEKRQTLMNVEELTGTSITILPNPNFETPHYHIERFRKDEGGTTTDGELLKSYQRDLSRDIEREAPTAAHSLLKSEPVVKPMLSTENEVPSSGFIKRVWESLFKSEEEKIREEEPAIAPRGAKPSRPPHRKPRSSQQQSRRGGSHSKGEGGAKSAGGKSRSSEGGRSKAGEAARRPADSRNESREDSRDGQRGSQGTRRGQRRGKPSGGQQDSSRSSHPDSRKGNAPEGTNIATKDSSSPSRETDPSTSEALSIPQKQSNLPQGSSDSPVSGEPREDSNPRSNNRRVSRGPGQRRRRYNKNTADSGQETE